MNNDFSWVYPDLPGPQWMVLVGSQAFLKNINLLVYQLREVMGQTQTMTIDTNLGTIPTLNRV